MTKLVDFVSKNSSSRSFSLLQKKAISSILRHMERKIASGKISKNEVA